MFNRIISAVQAVKYGVVEPFRLRAARLKFGNLYEKQDTPLVSIIIATYNRSEILVTRTIPSLLGQTYKNIEIIIVGDHCIDDTARKLSMIQDPRVKFFDLPKRGRYPRPIKDRWFVQGTKPRNVGMGLASGLWFVFISDDDVLYPEHIETLLNSAQKYDLEFISASYEEERGGFINKIPPLAFDPSRPAFKCGGMQTWLYRSYLRIFEWNIHSWRKSFNRPVDYDLVMRFSKRGVKMGHVDSIVAFIPAVQGTNTVGYAAALQSDKSN
jgi:glycosyltransferase involved in cell wall biosynthesis